MDDAGKHYFLSHPRRFGKSLYRRQPRVQGALVSRNGDSRQFLQIRKDGSYYVDKTAYAGPDLDAVHASEALLSSCRRPTGSPPQALLFVRHGYLTIAV